MRFGTNLINNSFRQQKGKRQSREIEPVVNAFISIYGPAETFGPGDFFEMIVWQHTLSEFMAGLGQGEGYSKKNPADELLAELTPPGWIKGTEVLLTEDEAFATAIAKREPMDKGNQVLLHKEGDGWRPVGAYIGNMIAIADAFRGHDPKLSTDLILRCAEHRPLPEIRELTVPGYKALARAHFAAVERAIGEGHEVPESVREDYGF